MTRSDLLRRLLASYSQGDDQAFNAVAEEIIADERRKNHQLLARELEYELHRERRRQGTSSLTLRPIPKSRDDRPLLRLTKPERELGELVLTPEVRTTVDEIVRENLSRATLTSHGLHPRQRLLFVGPPGTGKSVTAHGIAAELSLPVATASLAALTSSFLGDTARNIEAVVHFAEQTPCVLLFDEFDVLGQERSHPGDHGEIRRVAATVLQLLEDTHGESLIVATSNHPRLVDSAMWRRFDELVVFNGLDDTRTAELVALRLRAAHSTISPEEWGLRLAGLSPAEVEQVCLGALRRTVLDGLRVVNDEAMITAEHRIRVRAAAAKHGHTGPQPDETGI